MLYTCRKHTVLFILCKHTVTVQPEHTLAQRTCSSLLVCSTVGDSSHANADEDLRNILHLCVAM